MLRNLLRRETSRNLLTPLDISEMKLQIPFVASLWSVLDSGLFGLSARTHQVGAHFNTLNKGVLVAPLPFENCFSFQVSMTDFGLQSDTKFYCLTSNFNMCYGNLAYVNP